MKNQLLIEELKRCLVDMFEAEDKFHVLSYYIEDEQAHKCAVDRVRWFSDASDRITKVLQQYNEEEKNVSST